MDEQETRKVFTDALRALADTLDAHPNMPLPYIDANQWASTSYEDGWWGNDEHITFTAEQNGRDMRRGIPGWVKDAHDQHTGHVTYTKTFTPNDFYPLVRMLVQVSKSGTCHQIQTGTRHVEAVEAHDEPIMTWVCE